MYLITVARAVEEGRRQPIPVTEVTHQLEVSTVSAHQMVKKLAGRGLLVYTPYKGITLTDIGRIVAGRVLRRVLQRGRVLLPRHGQTPLPSRIGSGPRIGGRLAGT